MASVKRWLPCILAALVPLAIAAALAYWQAATALSDRARVLAEVVLERGEQTSAQMISAFTELASFGPSRMCSVAGVEAMRRIDLGSSLLQGVGYALGNRLICSSLDDRRTYDMGPPAIVSETGHALRPQGELPMAPGTPVLIVTDPAGYTAFVHPGLVFMLSGQDSPSAGIVGRSSRQPLLQSGDASIDWSRLALPPRGEQVLQVGELLVAVRSSSRWDYFSYAAVPASAIGDDLARNLWLFLSIGAIVAGGAGYLVHRLGTSRASLPALLRAGIARGEIAVVYQPIVELRTGRWVGVEALARWHRSNGESVPPDVFIPIAEQHGLIGAITEHVCETALRELSALTREPGGFFIGINIAPADLRGPHFAKTLGRLCHLNSVAPHAVHLELTEREDASSPELAQAIEHLRRLGYLVGSDDFGIGYSNLAYLDALTLDYIKIDRAFVGNAVRRGPGAEILDHIIGLAHARGLKVIAEGVETEAQRDRLLATGVEMGQGWLFGRPLPLAAFLEARRLSPARPLVRAVGIAA